MQTIEKDRPFYYCLYPTTPENRSNRVLANKIVQAAMARLEPLKGVLAEEADKVDLKAIDGQCDEAAQQLQARIEQMNSELRRGELTMSSEEKKETIFGVSADGWDNNAKRPAHAERFIKNFNEVIPGLLDALGITDHRIFFIGKDLVRYVPETYLFDDDMGGKGTVTFLKAGVSLQIDMAGYYGNGSQRSTPFHISAPLKEGETERYSLYY